MPLFANTRKKVSNAVSRLFSRKERFNKNGKANTTKLRIKIPKVNVNETGVRIPMNGVPAAKNKKTELEPIIYYGNVEGNNEVPISFNPNNNNDEQQFNNYYETYYPKQNEYSETYNNVNNGLNLYQTVVGNSRSSSPASNPGSVRSNNSHPSRKHHRHHNKNKHKTNKHHKHHHHKHRHHHHRNKN